MYFIEFGIKVLYKKLKNNGIDGKLLSLIESFLHNRYKNYS